METTDMESRSHHAVVLALGCLMTLPVLGVSHAAPPVAASISTPGHSDSAIGELVFKDGAPSAATRDAVYDNLDFTHAFNAFVNTFQGANMAAIRQGLLSIGVHDNEILVFSKLMDAKSLFLTANADTVYFIGFLDVSKGPMVLETPPGALGTLDDFWWRWVIDFGAPGPDRGVGGKYLILPPDYDGPVPEGGFYVARSRTNRLAILGRMFMEKNDPKPAVESIKKHTKIYPYQPGAVGTSVAQFLDGGAKLAPLESPPPTIFHEGSGRSFSTIPPNDYSFFTLIDSVVQQEPATSLDPELMGSLAAIGIVKGQPFAPDERMKRILTQAVEVANATSRTLFMNPRNPKWFYYPDSAWMNFLFESGSEFETPIPMITREGVKPFPPTGYRQLDARTAFFYGITGITPAMAMRLPGIGSQYLIGMLDADKRYLDGAKTYKVTLPPGIPEAKFWSFTLYDNQTRSMLDTPQRHPRAGSQSYPSPAAKADKDGTTTVYFSPKQPKGVNRGNWIQTDPEKGFFTILRLYSPLEPFFSKTWRPSEIEPVSTGR
jgi:hypothetical protein